MGPWVTLPQYAACARARAVHAQGLAWRGAACTVPRMGVIGTYCGLCALPVQHDHYVPEAEGGGMLRIYRGSLPGGSSAPWAPGEDVFALGPAHAWLEDAVAVRLHGDGPVLARGAVEDGHLRDRATGQALSVGDGLDTYVALHHACWARMGSPPTRDGVVTAFGSHGWAMVEPYQGQLFDFAELRDHGKGWMLVDPRGDGDEAKRSHARIDRMYQAERHGRPASARRATTIPEVLAADGAWTAQMLRDEEGDAQGMVRYRKNVRLGMDVAGYPTMVWLTKPYAADARGRPDAAGRAALDALELRLKDAAEAGGAAILVMVLIDQGTAEFILYAREEEPTCTVVETLPGVDEGIESTYSAAHDPEWRTYFEKMAPSR